MRWQGGWGCRGGCRGRRSRSRIGISNAAPLLLRASNTYFFSFSDLACCLHSLCSLKPGQGFGDCGGQRRCWCQLFRLLLLLLLLLLLHGLLLLLQLLLLLVLAPLYCFCNQCRLGAVNFGNVESSDGTMHLGRPICQAVRIEIDCTVRNRA